MGQTHGHHKENTKRATALKKFRRGPAGALAGATLPRLAAQARTRTCTMCHAEFPSGNALFRHLRTVCCGWAAPSVLVLPLHPLTAWWRIRFTTCQTPMLAACPPTLATTYHQPAHPAAPSCGALGVLELTRVPIAALSFQAAVRCFGIDARYVAVEQRTSHAPMPLHF